MSYDPHAIGRGAEALYESLTGAIPSVSQPLGDCVLDGHYVEVKVCTKPSGRFGQVRPAKFLPLAAYYVPDRAWHVVPAHHLVRMASRLERGYKAENPFESFNLHVHQIAAWRVEPAQLREATLFAIAESAAYPELRDAMARVLADARASADRVRLVLAGCPDLRGVAFLPTRSSQLCFEEVPA